MSEILLPFLIGSVVFNLALFIVAYILRSDKLTDISYALTFAAIAGAAYIANTPTVYSTLLVSMVILWALRIGGFLLVRVIRSGKDSRFDGMREDFWKFGRFWLLQGITVWILMIPSVLALNSGASSVTVPAYAGVALFLIGFFIETIADYQKMVFSRVPEHKGTWIDTGLWRYSRHPNYFGEILVWIGLYIYAIQTLNGWAIFAALASPIFISVLLLFVSGIPILEKSADKKWGSDPRYQQYKQQTSILVLLAPSLPKKQQRQNGAR